MLYTRRIYRICMLLCANSADLLCSVGWNCVGSDIVLVHSSERSVDRVRFRFGWSFSIENGNILPAYPLLFRYPRETQQSANRMPTILLSTIRLGTCGASFVVRLSSIRASVAVLMVFNESRTTDDDVIDDTIHGSERRQHIDIITVNTVSIPSAGLQVRRAEHSHCGPLRYTRIC